VGGGGPVWAKAHLALQRDRRSASPARDRKKSHVRFERSASLKGRIERVEGRSGSLSGENVKKRSATSDDGRKMVCMSIAIKWFTFFSTMENKGGGVEVVIGR